VERDESERREEGRDTVSQVRGERRDTVGERREKGHGDTV
jgi:hypothetical protein